MNLRSYLKTGLAVLLVGVVLSYGIYRTKDLVMGPSIIITSPQDGEVVHKAELIVEGSAARADSISLDDRPIFIDEAGHFREILLLFYGANTITVRGKDKFGRVVTKSVEVVYK